MYKSAARSSAYMGRSASYATHGSRRGVVDLIPRVPVLDWNPEYFEQHYALAKEAVAILNEGGVRLRAGAAAAAAVAASHFVHPDRARDAIESVLEGMIVHSEGSI
jgi:hypothetical protein